MGITKKGMCSSRCSRPLGNQRCQGDQTTCLPQRFGDRMMNKKSERGSQKAAAAEAANISETTGPSGIKPSGTLRICLELREEENELKIAGLSIVEAEENEDAKFARLLQEEYWKSMKQKKKSGFVMVHNRCLHISESRSASSCYLGAFKLNHPEALMFINNCNVISRAVMEKCADADDCISTTDAAELAASLDEKVKNDLPLPGQVDFINGGPSQHVCF